MSLYMYDPYGNRSSGQFPDYEDDQEVKMPLGYSVESEGLGAFPSKIVFPGTTKTEVTKEPKDVPVVPIPEKTNEQEEESMPLLTKSEIISVGETSGGYTPNTETPVGDSVDSSSVGSSQSMDAADWDEQVFGKESETDPLPESIDSGTSEESSIFGETSTPQTASIGSDSQMSIADSGTEPSAPATTEEAKQEAPTNDYGKWIMYGGVGLAAWILIKKLFK